MRANFVTYFVIANYLYKNAMLTWRQSFLLFVEIHFKQSAKRDSEEEKIMKNTEILSHPHQRSKNKIVAEGVCGSHFIVFSNRWVQTQFWLFLFESACERKHILLICSIHSLFYALYDNWKLLCRLLPYGIETISIFHTPHWCHRYIYVRGKIRIQFSLNPTSWYLNILKSTEF